MSLHNRYSFTHKHNVCVACRANVFVDCTYKLGIIKLARISRTQKTKVVKMKLEGALTEQTVNQRMMNIEYACRGPLLQRAEQIEREIQKGVSKPFQRVIRANIGDPHALGQQPVTFLRQVVGLCACPDLLPTADVPSDVKERVLEILADCSSGSVGAYSPHTGLRIVRNHAARYLQARDGVPASPQDVFLGSGATDLIKSVLQLFVQDVDGKPPGVMIPIPQYPLFSSVLTELGLQQVDYYLNEDNDWAVCLNELHRAWSQASLTCNVRAIVVINPGNPTSQVLSRDNIEEIIQFAYEHNLFVLADEVYQENIISKPFHSFKKVKTEMGDPYCGLELASFLTASKGWAAECGLRGAMVELQGVRPGVRDALLKSRGVMQCPSVLGQIVLDCILRPPQPGEPSYEQFMKEKSYIHQVLCERAALVYSAFNSIPGFSCNHIDGTMCAFPRIDLSARAQVAAAERGVEPDELYCMRLLEDTGICAVPGAGFGQRAGSFHLRTTILHPREELVHMMAAIKNFHLRFLDEYP